jgi:outer membrane receptor protein involved in Fe transport
VKEAFGELQIPILRDLPFFHELTVSGAGRVAEYKGATGTVFAYNGGVEYAPIRDIRFRANYGRAIRAPNQTETFGELIPNFAQASRILARRALSGRERNFVGRIVTAAVGANLRTFATQSGRLRC